MAHNTKTRLLICITLIFCLHFAAAQSAPSRFKTELDFGNGTVFSTFLKLKSRNGEFMITSPPDADVRLAGGKARIGRLMGKSPKKGSILTISGVRQADSLIGQTNIPMIGKMSFRGAVRGGVLSGEFRDAGGAVSGTLKGLISTEDKIDYAYLHPLIIKTVRENIYSAQVLETPEWRDFDKKLGELCREAEDDIELFFGFNMLARTLPFSHLSLMISDRAAAATDDSAPAAPSSPKDVVFEERGPGTAYLRIKNFSTSGPELAAVLPGIVSNASYRNLIIDLRDNPGGGVGAAFELARHIAREDLEAGYFLTNKLRYSGFEPELFDALPAVQPSGTKEFGELLRTSPGARLIFRKPDNPVFGGRLYVLTNGRTASTCEPIVHALKISKRATIVGSRTAGAMLSAFPFAVSGKYTLTLPIADFYTTDGLRLDKSGVAPDIEVSPEEAEHKALEMIRMASE